MTIELVPLTVAVVEVIKRMGFLDTKFIPLLSLVLGVVLTVATNGYGMDNVIQGLVIGAMAAGVYDAGKSSLKIAGVIK